MDFKQKINLSELTTFRLGGSADFYCVAQSVADLKAGVEFARQKKMATLILAGGSNLLVSDTGFRGLVIKIDLKGIEFLRDDEEGAEIKVAAGEIWDDVVSLAILKDLWGIENLSNIPGKTGAIPIQNVGAYGQEASLVVKSVEALNLEELEVQILANADCGFEYRQSNFNTIWQDKFAILSVTFRLSRKPNPNLSYIDVKKYFTAAQKTNPTLTEIRQAIIDIRRQKFPDLSQFGCVGSFFKNLILTPQQYLELEKKIRQNFPPAMAARLDEIKHKFPQVKGIKIPSAFLIDNCGLKGKSVGGAKLWENQPLVIVNTGKATTADVAELFKQVRQEVFAKTGMTLMNEPEFVGFTQEERNNYFKLV